MVASHVGESGESGNFGEYGDFGELLSNRQMYVNQFHTWWPATDCFNNCKIQHIQDLDTKHLSMAIIMTRSTRAEQK